MRLFRKRYALEMRPYRDDNFEYRWRLVARNNEIVADSAEGYKHKADRDEIMRKITRGPITIVEESGAVPTDP